MVMHVVQRTTYGYFCRCCCFSCCCSPCFALSCHYVNISWQMQPGVLLQGTHTLRYTLARTRHHIKASSVATAILLLLHAAAAVVVVVASCKVLLLLLQWLLLAGRVPGERRGGGCTTYTYYSIERANTTWWSVTHTLAPMAPSLISCVARERERREEREREERERGERREGERENHVSRKRH